MYRYITEKVSKLINSKTFPLLIVKMTSFFYYSENNILYLSLKLELMSFSVIFYRFIRNFSNPKYFPNSIHFYTAVTWLNGMLVSRETYNIIYRRQTLYF